MVQLGLVGLLQCPVCLISQLTQIRANVRFFSRSSECSYGMYIVSHLFVGLTSCLAAPVTAVVARGAAGRQGQVAHTLTLLAVRYSPLLALGVLLCL